ncbi:hypothetical protein TSOC_006866 [Tetrabaena socialis]|uniref:Uncharacterized protein n=1 Tax=Tetrabaena socialis TaxID=47790 RepID=A0A2J8A2H9_9CHLO|nr:hypothetical protein TSOC_006866 [Tetrabaena socialis]|eukprot:PNH06727.1 hypothetical protein TSOC_006866 [Tetrabaena socialis]
MPASDGASGAGDQGADPASLEAAAASVETIWRLVHERKLDELLRYVPDAVLEAADELRPMSEASTPLTFQDVVIQAHDIRGFTLDSFAARHLHHSPPTAGSTRRLSAIRTAPDRAVLRYAVAAEGGERSVLQFGMECREMLTPAYRSACIESVWQLSSVTGEADGAAMSDESGEPATRPHRSLPPEAVVQAQLSALLVEDMGAVFSFASPANQVVTGPLERFSQLLRLPMYRPLLRHRQATSYRRAMLGADSYNEIVKIRSDNTGMPQAVEAIYLWEVKRQGPSAGSFANCWMTDSVSLVTAKALN